jgi:YVTN family beta-propeller protein
VDGTVMRDGTVWFPLRGADELVRIDPATNAVAERIPAGTSPFVVNEAFGDLWVPSYGGADVRRIRP